MCQAAISNATDFAGLLISRNFFALPCALCELCDSLLFCSSPLPRSLPPGEGSFKAMSLAGDAESAKKGKMHCIAQTQRRQGNQKQGFVALACERPSETSDYKSLLVLLPCSGKYLWVSLRLGAMHDFGFKVSTGTAVTPFALLRALRVSVVNCFCFHFSLLPSTFSPSLKLTCCPTMPRNLAC